MQCRRCGFDPWVRKIPLEKARATHSSNLAWRIPWREEPLQSMGSQRVRHNVAINTFLFRKKTLDRQKTERSVKKNSKISVQAAAASNTWLGTLPTRSPIRASSSGAGLGRRAKPLPNIVGWQDNPGWNSLRSVLLILFRKRKHSQPSVTEGSASSDTNNHRWKIFRRKKFQAAPGTCICHAPAPIYTAFTMSDEYPRGDLEWMGRLCRSHTNIMLFYMKGLSICEYPISVGSWNQPPEDTQGQR